MWTRQQITQLIRSLNEEAIETVGDTDDERIIQTFRTLFDLELTDREKNAVLDVVQATPSLSSEFADYYGFTPEA